MPKHAISSPEFMLQLRGFKDGASVKPIDPSFYENAEYNQGYKDGVKARRDYSKKLCLKLNLVDPEIKPLCLT